MPFHERRKRPFNFLGQCAYSELFSIRKIGGNKGINSVKWTTLEERARGIQNSGRHRKLPVCDFWTRKK